LCAFAAYRFGTLVLKDLGDAGTAGLIQIAWLAERVNEFETPG
jgi:hypothetical protein